MKGKQITPQGKEYKGLDEDSLVDSMKKGDYTEHNRLVDLYDGNPQMLARIDFLAQRAQKLKEKEEAAATA